MNRHAPLLDVRDLGRLAYAPALEIQRQTHQRVLDGHLPPNAVGVLLLVEHDPVITVSQRQGSDKHLLATPATLSALGIDVQPTDRGGDITYHGPGQLVAYPILRLAPLRLNVGRYMRLLEEVVVQTVATFGVQAHTVPGATGVWVEDRGWGQGAGGRAEEEQTDASTSSDAHDPSTTLNSESLPPGPQTPDPGPSSKLCALGVRVRRNVTMHGLALNVTTDLSHFETIVPCGLANRAVTSLSRLLGENCPAMDVVKAELVAQFERALTQYAPLPT